MVVLGMYEDRQVEDQLRKEVYEDLHHQTIIVRMAFFIPLAKLTHFSHRLQSQLSILQKAARSPQYIVNNQTRTRELTRVVRFHIILNIGDDSTTFCALRMWSMVDHAVLRVFGGIFRVMRMSEGLLRRIASV